MIGLFKMRVSEMALDDCSAYVKNQIIVQKHRPLSALFLLNVVTLTACSRTECVFCGVQIIGLFHGADTSIFFEIHKIFGVTVNFQNVSR